MSYHLLYFMCVVCMRVCVFIEPAPGPILLTAERGLLGPQLQPMDLSFPFLGDTNSCLHTGEVRTTYHRGLF